MLPREWSGKHCYMVLALHSSAKQKFRMRAMHFAARVYLSIDFSTTKGRAHGTFQEEKYASHPECHEDDV